VKESDPNKNRAKGMESLRWFRESSFPPAALLGAFVGRCNPEKLAVAPDGKNGTAEKVAARVKVYEPSGKLPALIGPENFDPRCTPICLAVDSKGRIVAADQARLEVRIFSVRNKFGDNGNL
jgi:hypothetical protein